MNMIRMGYAQNSKEMLAEAESEMIIAENKYHNYLLNHRPADNAAFKEHLNNVVRNLELLNNRIDSIQIYGIGYDITKKIKLSDSLSYLKVLADSLLRNTDNNIDSFVTMDSVYLKKINTTVLSKILIKATDTVKISSVSKKRNFIQKIGDAFSSKKNDSTKVEYIKNNASVNNKGDSIAQSHDSVLHSASNYLQQFYQKEIDKQMGVRKLIAANEKELIALNLSLFEQVNNIFKEIQQQEFNILNLFIKSSEDDIERSKKNIEKAAVTALILILILTALLAWNIVKNIRYEKGLIAAYKRAEDLAQAKTRFLRNMSHEIRSPLTAIMGFAEQLEKNSNNQHTELYVQAIKSGSEHLGAIVNQILDFSKFEAGKPVIKNEPLHLKKVIEDVVYSMQINADKKNIALIATVNIADDIVVNGDKVLLKQILYNLLGNAVKFTHKGTVKLTAGIQKKEEGAVSLHLTVADSGIGISKEELPLLFNEFSQLNTHSAQELSPAHGTGLGLFIIKKIIELHKGAITVQSETGKGSIFTVNLPYQLCKNIPLQQTTESAAVKNIDISKSRILVIDDDALIGLLISKMLSNNQLPFDIATNSEDAMELFNANLYSLVITDIYLPGISGMELTKTIRSHSDAIKSKLPVIAFTANVLKEDLDSYVSSGMNGYITKPTTEDLFIKTIKQYL